MQLFERMAKNAVLRDHWSSNCPSKGTILAILPEGHLIQRHMH
jgi:hypothetical protein